MNDLESLVKLFSFASVSQARSNRTALTKVKAALVYQVVGNIRTKLSESEEAAIAYCESLDLEMQYAIISWCDSVKNKSRK
ncbi:MAG: hypothetical protein ACK5YH_15570 [Pseudanabaena sp.]|jgi:hypothetical protein